MPPRDSVDVELRAADVEVRAARLWVMSWFIEIEVNFCNLKIVMKWVVGSVYEFNLEIWDNVILLISLSLLWTARELL